MLKTLLCCTAAFALGASSMALAKTPPASSSTTDPNASAPAKGDTSTPPATSSSGASTGASTDTSASAKPTAPLSVGMTVKDSAGAEVGKVVDLKADASGTQMATIQMGTDKFAVAATSIGVQNGAGVINLTKADLQAKLHPSH